MALGPAGPPLALEETEMRRVSVVADVKVLRGARAGRARARPDEFLFRRSASGRQQAGKSDAKGIGLTYALIVIDVRHTWLPGLGPIWRHEPVAWLDEARLLLFNIQDRSTQVGSLVKQVRLSESGSPSDATSCTWRSR